MKPIRRLNKGIVYIVSLLLSLSLFSNQGAALLHVHDMNHDNHNSAHHEHTITDNAARHSHVSKIHTVLDASHLNHHNEVALEVDISPDGVLKNLSSSLLTLAFLVFTIFFILPVVSRQLLSRPKENKLILSGRYIISPPLRAPPAQ